MFGVVWRLALLGVCIGGYFIPFVNILAFLATPVLLPVAAYCFVSASARIWKRNTAT